MKYYVMVRTAFGGWNKLVQSENFTLDYIKGVSKIEEERPTVFIDSSDCWLGSVRKIQKNQKAYGNKEAISFDYELEYSFNLPYNHELRKLKTGWYELELNFDPLKANPEDLPITKMAPRFFTELEQTTNWKLFEDYGFYLLKLLGIHNMRKYQSGNNQGRADGFFQFHGLNVLFDFTLHENFSEKKESQIVNYIQQLKKGEINFDNRIFSIHPNDVNQVWIITRGQTQLLKDYGDVVAKEISINDIFEMYFDRLFDEKMDDKVFKKKLENLEPRYNPFG